MNAVPKNFHLTLQHPQKYANCIHPWASKKVACSIETQLVCLWPVACVKKNLVILTWNNFTTPTTIWTFATASKVSTAPHHSHLTTVSPNKSHLMMPSHSHHSHLYLLVQYSTNVFLVQF